MLAPDGNMKTPPVHPLPHLAGLRPAEMDRRTRREERKGGGWGRSVDLLSYWCPGGGASLGRCALHEPRRLPWPPGRRPSPAAEQKEQLRPDKQTAFLGPIDFLIFWHFWVASIPFLVFSSVSQKTKMSEQLRPGISISCQPAPQRMPRTGKTTNSIIFFFLFLK